jgi:hypothetical protein
LGVVDDVVRTDRPDQVHVPRAAHAGHVRSERLRDLNGEGAHAPRRTDDQDLLPWLDPSVIAQTLQRGQRGQRYGRRLLERQVGRLQFHERFRDACVLGKATRRDVGVHLVTRPKPRHLLADRLDLPGHVAPETTVLRYAQPDRSHDVRQASHEMPVTGIDGDCADAYQDFVIVHDGFVDLFELENIG